ncbi:MAG: tetratricopeptide repeat protein [Gaiellaceae bacterium]
MTVTERYRSTHLDDVWASGNWTAIRRHFGIEAFGINAWKGAEEGDQVISEHTEAPTAHQELYLVLDGHAEFTVGEKTVDAPRGTFVFVRDPETGRRATAKEAGTTVLAIGGKPGEAFAVREWEASAEAFPLFEQGEFARAKEVLEEARRQHPEAAGVLYNLACAEARLGERDVALEHLREAVSRDAQFLEYAQADEDLESIRAEPGFPSA